ncbi:cuticle protein 16.5 [Manduca sexta]|uniref:Cuticle protein n=1 Tax=Manduca sexta TaxID=7130 RepID=A0A921YMR9_MANSE|nr:cuticle protein 16.5 [Manduca sexta]KAG6442256.1 hypothetical protein O3G_MSEX002259 [Manduca sexta]
MKSMVVFFALAAVACGSYVAQPAHHAALVLDPHGRPLDTAEVINARALHYQAKALEPQFAHGVAAIAPVAVAPVAHAVAPVAHAVAAPVVSYAGPAAAVSHQSRVDVRTSHAVAAPVIAHAAPVIAAAPVLAHGAAPLLAHGAAPLLAHSALGHGAHGHYLKKRSLGHFGHAYAVPAIAPAAVSHQSRVDVINSPAVVAHAVAAPVVAHAAVAAPVVAHAALAAPAVAVAPAAAVSHQSRVDVRTSPAIVAHVAAAPLAHSVVAAPVAHAGLLHAAPLAHAGLLHGAHGHLAHGW